jgi:hypothetical protein
MKTNPYLKFRTIKQIHFLISTMAHKTKTVQIATLVALSFTACKKDRTCECIDTQSQTSSLPGFQTIPIPPSKSSVKYANIKKNNVLVTTCVNREYQFERTEKVYDNSNNTFTNYAVTTTIKSDCKLK